MGGMLKIFFVAFCIVSIVLTSYSVPFIIIRGINRICNERFMSVVKFYETFSGAIGNCIDVGNRIDDTIFVPLLNQVATVCERIKKMHHLRDGYNILAFSQGGLVARGVIEFCDGGPPVKNFISVGAPHAGVSSFPEFPLSRSLMSLSKLSIYSNFVQNHIAPSGYVKLPDRIKAYIRGSKFLPKLNNEIDGQRNSTYKERFSNLENLVLIMFEKESIAIPKESAWFGYYPDGASSIVPVKMTKLYMEDWIGLKTLDEAGKVHFVTENGRHLQLSPHTKMEVIIPLLKDITIPIE